MISNERMISIYTFQEPHSPYETRRGFKCECGNMSLLCIYSFDDHIESVRDRLLEERS